MLEIIWAPSKRCVACEEKERGRKSRCGFPNRCSEQVALPDLVLIGSQSLCLACHSSAAPPAVVYFVCLFCFPASRRWWVTVLHAPAMDRLGASLLDEHTLWEADEARIVHILCSHDLAVPTEDAVLGAVLLLWRAKRVSFASWRCVRFSYCSSGAVQQMREWLTHSFAGLPPELGPLFRQHMRLRAARKAAAAAAGTPIAIVLQPPPAVRPRSSYCFSTDAVGGSRVGAGMGMFFIWLSPADPLAANSVDPPPPPLTDEGVPPAAAAPSIAHPPLPSRYRGNIRGWGRAYDASPTVFNGAQCLLAVQEAATHPEFFVSAPAGAAWRADVPPLEAHYRALAAAGAWIQCVDIARLTIAWLVGGVYLDCDMSVGPHRLPRELLAQPPAPTLLPEGGALVPHPFCVLAQDADGLLQNNFIGVRGAFHPFLTLLLQGILVSAGGEPHVVHATGPALFTALYYAFQGAQVAPSPSLISLVGSCASPAVAVPANDPAVAMLRASLPAGVPDASLGYVAGIPHAGLTVLTEEEEGEGGDHSADIGGGRTRPLTSLALRDVMWVCPPSTFYPRHWRDVPPPAPAAAEGGGGGDANRSGEGGEAVGADTAAAAAATALLAEALPGGFPLRSRSGGQARGRGSVGSMAEWVPLASVSVTANSAMASAIAAANSHRREEARRARTVITPKHAARPLPPPPPLISNAAAESSSLAAAAAAGSPAADSAGGGVGGRGGSIQPPSLRRLSLHGGDAAQLGHLYSSGGGGGGGGGQTGGGGSEGWRGPSGVVSFGSHSWDCTWGAYPASAGGFGGDGGGVGSSESSSSLGSGGSASPPCTSTFSASFGYGYAAALCGYGAAQRRGDGGGRVAASNVVAGGGEDGGGNAAHSGGNHLLRIDAGPGSPRSYSPSGDEEAQHPRDIFGVVSLAKRVLARLVEAGLAVEDGWIEQ